MSKGLRALFYVVIGTAVIILLIDFIAYLWISTIFPGMWWIRKPLYLLSFLGIIIAGWFVHEGLTYLARH